MKTQITSTSVSTLVSTAILGTFVLACAPPSRAADGDVIRQVVVRYDDLNLSSPRGAAALYSRISGAAHEVCGAQDSDIRDVGIRSSVNACVRKAISGAVTRVGRPELFAIYNAKNPAPLGTPVAAAQTR
jgi:UrcA family protein